MNQQSNCRPFVLHCGRCGAPGHAGWECAIDAEIEHILTMTDADILADAWARGIDPEQNAIEMRAMFERAKAHADDKLKEQQWQVVIGDGSGVQLPPFDATIERVFTPVSLPEHEQTPVEEADPPPSGWRDRPGLL